MTMLLLLPFYLRLWKHFLLILFPFFVFHPLPTYFPLSFYSLYFFTVDPPLLWVFKVRKLNRSSIVLRYTFPCHVYLFILRLVLFSPLSTSSPPSLASPFIFIDSTIFSSDPSSLSCCLYPFVQFRYGVALLVSHIFFFTTTLLSCQTLECAMTGLITFKAKIGSMHFLEDQFLPQKGLHL